MKKITAMEIEILVRYIDEISGIQLDQKKGYLLENRLQPLMLSYGTTTYMELHRKATSDSTGTVKSEIIDAITTKETLFFRDITPFDLMKNKIIPELLDRRRQGNSSHIPIGIWSAACSTGQEVYSIGITLLEMLQDIQRCDIRILGTDISEQAVVRARMGKYNPFELKRGMPMNWLNKYFDRLGDEWHVKTEIRNLARFEKLDLMRPFSELGRFDLVFCRNVAIYFSRESRIQLYQKIARILRPDGALIVGGSESLRGLNTDFEPHRYKNGLFYKLKE